jgi:hypothetical protein
MKLNEGELGDQGLARENFSLNKNMRRIQLKPASESEKTATLDRDFFGHCMQTTSNMIRVLELLSRPNKFASDSYSREVAAKLAELQRKFNEVGPVSQLSSLNENLLASLGEERARRDMYSDGYYCGEKSRGKPKKDVAANFALEWKVKASQDRFTPYPESFLKHCWQVGFADGYYEAKSQIDESLDLDELSLKGGSLDKLKKELDISEVESTENGHAQTELNHNAFKKFMDVFNGMRYVLARIQDGVKFAKKEHDEIIRMNLLELRDKINQTALKESVTEGKTWRSEPLGKNDRWRLTEDDAPASAPAPAQTPEEPVSAIPGDPPAEAPAPPDGSRPPSEPEPTVEEVVAEFISATKGRFPRLETAELEKIVIAAFKKLTDAENAEGSAPAAVPMPVAEKVVKEAVRMCEEYNANKKRPDLKVKWAGKLDATNESYGVYDKENGYLVNDKGEEAILGIGLKKFRSEKLAQEWIDSALGGKGTVSLKMPFEKNTDRFIPYRI